MVSVISFDRELTMGEKVRFVRLSKRWRQIDVAAIVRCSPSDVSCLERDTIIPPGVRRRILDALGIEDDGEA